MEHRTWKLLVRAVRSADRRRRRVGRRKVYSDQQIVKMYLWAVMHDRPMYWACDLRHYYGWYRPSQLPSVSQFSRRLRTARVQGMLKGVNEYVTRESRSSSLSFLDGKPLPLSRNTRDREAKKGYCNGTFERGYKLHAWATSDGAIPCFAVRSMNEGEPAIARDLVPYVNYGSLVLADANYDSALLYQTIHCKGGQLLTRLKGMSENPDQLQRMGAGRRTAIRWWKKMPRFCEALMVGRASVERTFSALTCFGGGLTTLPPWVRGLRRVTNWVTAKIAIYNARLRCRVPQAEVA